MASVLYLKYSYQCLKKVHTKVCSFKPRPICSFQTRSACSHWHSATVAAYCKYKEISETGD